jgi:N-acetylneuraminic acid mutarotase
MSFIRLLWLPALIALTPAAPIPAHRHITFQQRVEAQRAIERVYYSHQDGATQPFDRAITNELLERKVRAYLGQSIALEKIWGTTLTSGMLRDELARIARDSHMPERLRELYAALNDDPVLILECLVRPVLADRLGRQRFEADTTIHAASLRQASRLRAALVEGRLEPGLNLDDHSVTELVRVESEAWPTSSEDKATSRFEVDPQTFEDWRRRLPATAGEIAPVSDDGVRFVIRQLLEQSQDHLVFATYTVAKKSWDEWWRAEERELGSLDVATVVEPGVAMPGPALAPACDSWGNGQLGNFPDRVSARIKPDFYWTGSVAIIWAGHPYETGVLGPGALYDPATDTWKEMSRINEPAVGASIWIGSAMLVFDLANSANSRRFDPISNTWSSFTTAPFPYPPRSVKYVWTGSEVIEWGGYGGGYLNTGARYNPQTDTWTPLPLTGAPSARDEHTAVWTGSKMVIWGGFDGSTALNTGAMFDPVSSTWTPTSTTNAPVARYEHTATWTGSVIFIYGGIPTGRVGGRFNPATNTWQSVSFGDGRYNHTAVWDGSRVLIWGGDFPGYNDYLNSGFRYDPVADTVLAINQTGAPSGRNTHAAVWTGSMMLITGGYQAGPTPRRTCGRYNPATDTWLASPPPSEPRGRTGAGAVWTGSMMLVWGGLEDSEALGTGFRYDPALDSASPLQTLNAPAASVFVTGVWSGSEMIVWGGNGAGRYNPASGVWSPVSTTGSPSNRRNQSAVWTGSEMIVWGGYLPNTCVPFSCWQYYADGARYNPATNVWTPVSPTGSPSARADHTAVWTGSRMLIWGGQVCTGTSCPSAAQQFADGGLYNPATDSWAAVSATGAPSKRSGHTAVWSGSRMIVWGGEIYGGSGPRLGDGGIYDPGAGTWSSVTTTAAPSARSRHTAVWTGAEMLVWGGTPSFGVVLNTGARYDPVGDTWQALPTTGAPVGRSGHVGVWTGDSFLLWGGSAEWGTTRSGGRYMTGPSSDQDLDGFAGCQDCNDSNPAVYPGAPQICDGANNDCNSPGWPSLVGTNESDGDSDGLSSCQGDCDDANASVWSTPGEAQDLILLADQQSLTWLAPSTAGGTAWTYDTIKSGSPVDFVNGAVCVETNGADTQSTDATQPAPGAALFYLVRAENACPGALGRGPLGAQSNGTPRTGRDCP